MSLPREDVDPNGLQEFSVVFTDRAVNHMSQKFVDAMQEFYGLLRDTYNADAAVVVPGSGSFGMESVARQFMEGQPTLVVRDGFFSYRWSQIIEMGKLTDHEVVSAVATDDSATPGFAPPAVDQVIDAIKKQGSKVVAAAHVETASGIVLTDEYIKALADAVHEQDGLFVLDCIASGALWVDMKELGVDVLISAPQKGWSGWPGMGYVMLNERALARLEETESSSFSMDLKKWHTVSETYRAGKHMYHATMPTDAMLHNLDVMREAKERGLDKIMRQQVELGERVRVGLAERGYKSVAAEGWEAPSVVVVYTDDPQEQSGAKFKAGDLQVASGVPLQVGEPEGFSTFRVGLFGLDKWDDVEGTVQRLFDGIDKARKA